MADDLSEVSIDFSVEELIALSDALGLGPPAVLGDDPLGTLTLREQSLVLDGARRCLVARQIMLLDEDSLSVVPAVARLVELIAGSGVAVRAQREREGVVDSTFYSAHPDVTVEQVERAASVYRLTPFPTEELLVRMLHRCGLEARPQVDTAPFAIMLADLVLVSERLAAGEREKALDDFVSSAGATDGAARFARALDSKVQSARIAVLHAPDENVLTGGELTWLDGGDHGLWLTPMVEPAPAALASAAGSGGTDPYGLEVSLTVESTSAEAIAAEVLSYLPSAG